MDPLSISMDGIQSTKRHWTKSAVALTQAKRIRCFCCSRVHSNAEVAGSHCHPSADAAGCNQRAVRLFFGDRLARGHLRSLWLAEIEGAFSGLLSACKLGTLFVMKLLYG